MKRILKLCFLVVFVNTFSQVTVPPSGITNTENYVYSRTYLEAVTAGSTSAKQVESITYFDGLGRAKQNIALKATAKGNDLVTTIPYDGFGRQVDSYFPVPMTTNNAGIQALDATGVVGYYTASQNTTTKDFSLTDLRPFSHKELEASPLDRINQQIDPGTDWQNKPVGFTYEANADTEVKKFVATASWDTTNKIYNNTLTLSTEQNVYASGGYYKGGTLYKNTVTDEDGNASIEFKNGEGQTLLVRKVISSTQNADTYYVYNDYNQLAYVISPLALNTTLLSTDLDNLCYQYKYDSRNKLAEKKLPGKGWEYMVYDQQDRLVLTQDGNLRVAAKNNFLKQGWLFTKYDKFGRVVYTGFFQNGASRSSMQTALNSMSANAGNNEDRVTSPSITLQGLPLYYTKNAFPTGSMTLLSVNYYDAYPLNTPAFDNVSGQSGLVLLNATETSFPATTVAASVRSTKSLPLASFVKNIENDAWTKSYSFYDTQARPLGTYSFNYLGGFTKSESKLLFSGKPDYTVTAHSRASSTTENSIKETFEYDLQERLVRHYNQVNSGTQELLAENVYNEIGQLKTKNVGNTVAAPLQSVDYKYNIRGWLSQINDPVLTATKLFGYQIYYNTLDSHLITNSVAKYNGNIAQVAWATQSDQGIERVYSYKYDALNRLTDSWQWNASTLYNGEYQENLTYDVNGNIKTLYRTGKITTPQLFPELMDKLTYHYANSDNSNQLVQITEAAIGGGNAQSGYPLATGQNGAIIGYDGGTVVTNGNMTSMPDKGISSITYNYLNLPVEIKVQDSITAYMYRADGVKIKKSYGAKVNPAKITTYLDGFQYQNNVLQFIPTAEGYYDFIKNAYIYNYTDHLGNVRVSYSKNSAGVPVIIEENNYYAFGLKQEGYNPNLPPSTYNYKYNGKELQETGMYDYGARMYMPDIGRWGTVDPLAEASRKWSPYNYAYNNPIRFIDPDGRKVVESATGTMYTEEEAQNAFRQLLSSMSGKGSSNEPDDIRFRDKDGKLIATYKTDKFDADVSVNVGIPKATNIDLNKKLSKVGLEDIDIVGVGLDLDFTFVMGGGKAIESVFFLDGKDAGKSENYVTTRQNVGLNGGVGVYAIAGDYYEDKNLKTTDYAGASFALSAGVSGPTVSSYSKFWSPKNPSSDPTGFRSLFNSNLRAWSGYNVGGGAGAGGQWSKQNTTIYNSKKK